MMQTTFSAQLLVTCLTFFEIQYNMPECFVLPVGVAGVCYTLGYLLLPGLQCVYCLPDTCTQLGQPLSGHINVCAGLSLYICTLPL